MPITENCTVVSIKKQTVYIKLIDNAKCEGCKACGFGRKNIQVLPAYDCGLSVKVGDTVKVEMPDKKISTAAYIMYLIPLALFFIGLVSAVSLGEGFMLLFAAIGLAVGFVAVYFIDKLYKNNKKFLPKITEKINIEEMTND